MAKSPSEKCVSIQANMVPSEKEVNCLHVPPLSLRSALGQAQPTFFLTLGFKLVVPGSARMQGPVTQPILHQRLPNYAPKRTLRA